MNQSNKALRGLVAFKLSLQPRDREYKIADQIITLVTNHIKGKVEQKAKSVMRPDKTFYKAIPLDEVHQLLEEVSNEQMD